MYVEFTIFQGTEKTLGKDTIILGYYVFSVKITENGNSQQFFTVTSIKAVKSLTHSSSQLEEIFLLRIVDLYGTLTPTQFHIWKFHTKSQIKRLFPFMVT